MKKVIFLDVDGTLTNYENVIPKSAVRAVSQARKNGHLVFLCTGRSRAEIYDEIWNIGFDGMIGGNGSYVEVDGKVILHQLLILQQCRHIVDWLHERKLEFYLESNNGLFASEHFETKAEKAIQIYMGRKGKASKNVTVKDVFPEMCFDGELYRDDCNKVSFLLSSYQDHLDSITEFPDLQCHTWGGADETALFGDIGVKDISKAYAIDVLLQHLKMDRKDTIAFGDAKIDIPMLEYCEIGVAVGSGGEEIRSMADYVTDAVDDDGIYHAFVHFGLIQEKTDYHVHCEYSDDSQTPMEEVVISAIEKGISELCFTDHVDYGIKIDWDEEGMTPRLIDGKAIRNVNYPDYFKEIEELQKKYKGQIALKKGLELGVQSHTIDKFKRLCDQYPLDFAILSIHQVDDKEFFTQDFQRGRTQKEYNEAYYDEMLNVVQHFDQYSVLGHVDLIVRYDLNGPYPFECIKEKLTQIFRIIIDQGKGIEVNTSSFKYGLNDLTPARNILRLYYEMGGRIITIGSDSHKTETLASHYEEIKEELKQIGFTHHCVFDKMKPVFLPL